MISANGSPRKQKPKIPPDVDNPPFYLPLKSFNGRYKIVSNLGNGSFGNVGLAKSTQNIMDSSKFKIYRNTLLERNQFFNHENYFNKKTGLVAIKTMTKKLNQLNDYSKVKEIRFILAVPYHQNLVQIYEMFIDNVNFKLHIVMECLDQNLYQLMKARKNNHFSQTTLKSILSQILNGIRHIHRNQYFHRDIKPENILVSPAHRFYDQEFINSENFKYHDSFIVKIADYGLARHIDNKRPYTSYVSTRWYRAPEILLRKKWYSRPVDIWAFGSVAAEVATFRPLFPGSDEIEQTWKVLDVLGTPISSNAIGNYFPCYGYWDEAQALCKELGLKLPVKECIDISLLIPNPDLASLCDVIKACLAWNPYTRADVETICAMSYFKGTCVDESPTIPIPVPPAYVRGSKRKHYTTTNYTGSSYNFSKAEVLVGIPSLKKDLDSEDINVEFVSSENDDFQNMSPDATEINYSFLNDDIQEFSPDDKDCLNGFELQLPPKLQKADELSSLTQDNVFINDENYNGFNNNYLQYSNNNQINLVNSKPRTTVIKPFSDLSPHNNSNNNNGQFNEIISSNIDPNFICYQPQPVPAQSYNLDDGTGSINMRTGSIGDFDEWNRSIAGVPAMTNGVNVNSSFSYQLDNFDDKSKYHSSTHDSLLGFSTNDHNPTYSDHQSVSSNIPTFTGELLSKFNLRRIQPNDSTKVHGTLQDHSDSFNSYNNQ